MHIPNSAYDNWKCTPPEEPTCPVCDEFVVGDKYEGECSNPECDFSYHTDYETLLSN